MFVVSESDTCVTRSWADRQNMSQYVSASWPGRNSVLSTTKAKMHQTAGCCRMMQEHTGIQWLYSSWSQLTQTAEDLFKPCSNVAGHWRHAKGQKDISEGSLEIKEKTWTPSGVGDKVKNNGKQWMTWRKTRWKNQTQSQTQRHPILVIIVISECVPASICPRSSWRPDDSFIVSLSMCQINCHPMLAWHVLGAGKELQVTSFELYGNRLEFSSCTFKNTQADCW